MMFLLLRIMNTSLFKVSLLIIVGGGLLAACLQPMSEAEFQQRQQARLAPSSSAASYAAPELGVVVDEMMKVVDVDPGNAADKAGVQKGDILISIEDIPFAAEKAKVEELIWGSADEAIYEEYAKTGEWKGKILRLRVERNGENIDLEIMPFPPMWDPKAPPTPGYPPLDYL